MGVYLVSDGTSRPYRVHIKAPGFIHLVNTFFFSYQILFSLSIGCTRSYCPSSYACGFSCYYWYTGYCLW